MDERESILIVDDDESTRRSLTLIFEKKGYETETAGTGREAIEQAQGRFFNLALLDIRLSDVAGVELVAPLKERHPDMVVIMVTAYASLETAVRALNNGASAYITKPLNMDAVLATVGEALEKQRLVMENRRLFQEAQRELVERKRVEEALAREHNLLRTLIDNLPDYIYFKDTECRFLLGNIAVAQIMGAATPDDLIGKMDFDFYPQELAAQYYAAEQKIIRSGCPQFNREEPVIDPSGNRTWILTTQVPLRDSQGVIVGLVGISRDITERKRAAEEIKYIAYHDTLTGLPNRKSFIVLKPDATIQTVNRAALDLLGYTEAELIGQPVDMIFAAEAFEEIGFDDLMKTGFTKSVETTYRAKGGRQIPVSLSASVIHYGDEQIQGIVCVAHDISEIKQAERELRENEKLLRKIVENYPNSYLSIIEKDYTVGFTSGQKFKNQNLDPEQFIGLTLEEVFGDNTATIREHYEKTFGGEEHSFELFIGNQYLFFRTVPLLSEDGSIHRILVVVENVTERKQAEEALRESEARFSAFMDYLPAAVFIKDEKSTMLYVNKYMYDTFSAKDWIGKTAEELFPRELGEAMIADDRKALSKGYHMLIETVSDKNGIEHIYQTHKFAIKRKDKSPLLGGISMDITERKWAEKELRETLERLEQSEDRFMRLFEQSPVAQEIFDPDGYQVKVNSAWKKLWNAEPPPPGTYNALLDPQIEALGIKEALVRSFKGEEFVLDKVWFDPAKSGMEGQMRCLRTSAYAIKNKDGQVLNVVVNNEDITDRIKAEAELQESQLRYSTLTDNAPVGIWHADPEGRGGYINAELAKISGLTLEEAQADGWASALHPDDKDRVFKEWMDFVKGKAPYHSTYRFVRPNGEVRWVIGQAVSAKGTDRNLLGFVGTLSDITEHKQMEDALQFKNALLLTQQETSLDGILVVDKDGKMISYNQKYIDMWGIPLDIQRSKSDERALQYVLDKLVEPEEFITRVRTLYEHPRQKSHEQIKLTDGRIFERYSASMFGEDQVYHGRVWYFRDITERVQSESALRESEERYKRLANNAPDIIYRFRYYPKSGFDFVSPAVTAISGYTPKEHYDDPGLGLKMIHPDDRTRLEDFEKGILPQSPQTVRWIRKDGKTIWMEDRHTPILDENGHLIAIEGVARDITERKQAEEALQEYSERLEEMVEQRTQELRETQEELVRKEKLAVLGQLAGGVGHELRNPLGAIKNAAYFLNMVLEAPEPEVRETLEILEKEVATSEKIISSLLDFARPKPPIRRRVDINDVLREALSRTMAPENVEVVSQLDEALPNILADPDQLAQVFGNLILNGIQAMPEGGRLVVKTSDVSGKRPTSGWVTVSCTDTGEGIAEENLERLFEPLFTTKAKGIGLGLALVKALVEGHGGTIEVQSEVGKGSTFTVKLPTGREEEEEHGRERTHPDR